MRDYKLRHSCNIFVTRSHLKVKNLRGPSPNRKCVKFSIRNNRNGDEFNAMSLVNHTTKTVFHHISIIRLHCSLKCVNESECVEFLSEFCKMRTLN